MGIGGEHEFFDDLMAFRLFDQMCPGDLSVLVEVDFELGERQFDGAAIQTSRA